MIHPINIYNTYNNHYYNNSNPNFTGLKKISPVNYCMGKVLNKYTNMSNNRWFPIDNTLKPFSKIITLKKGENVTKALDINPYNSDKYVIFYHGLGQNISSNQEVYKRIIAKGYGILTSEYAFFGKSKGKMNAKSIKHNTDAAIEYLNNKGIETANIGIMGYSMGSFPAIDLATKRNDFRFLILISPFNSLKNEKEMLLQDRMFNLPSYMKYAIKNFPFLLKIIDNTFKTNKKIKNLELPIYLIHSENDKIIPVKSTKQLANFSKNLKAFILLKTGGHIIEENKIKAFEKLTDI